MKTEIKKLEIRDLPCELSRREMELTVGGGLASSPLGVIRDTDYCGPRPASSNIIAVLIGL